MDNTIDIEKKIEPAPDTVAPLMGIEFPVGGDYVGITHHSLQTNQWHWHEEVEFVIIKEGFAILQLPDEKLYLSSGEGIFLTPKQLHAIRPVDCEQCTLCTLKFDPAFLFSYSQSTLASKFLIPVLDSPAMQYLGLKKGNPINEEILNLVQIILSLFFEKQFGYELRIKGYLCELWYLLLSLSQDTSRIAPTHSPHASLDDERVKEAMLFIQKNYMEPLTLEDIANSIHVSKSECCRCFQRALGLTAFDYLLKYRIFESTRKIMRGDRAAESISTLAASVGFNNASYYNKIFKKHLGCTPTEYKKALQDNAK